MTALSRNVLIVEDDAVIRRMLTRLLEARGLAVAAACDGVEALAASKRRRFDAALVDIDLGSEPDGIAVGLAIKARNARVFMMSGDLGNSGRVAQAGLGTMLLKPFEIQDVLALLGV